jgi:transposase
MLLPNPKKGQIIIMDNASIHKSKEIRAAIKKAGCHLVFQPPYSPDLNPIEHCWSWMKRKSRSLNLTPHSLEEIVKCARIYSIVYNGLEAFWSFAKRRLAKLKDLRDEHFPLHLKECAFRYNNRGENLSDILTKMVNRQKRCWARAI